MNVCYYFNMVKKPWTFYLSLFLLAFGVSVFLFTTGILFAMIGIVQTVPLLAEFLSGFFYSSFISSPLAIFMIGILAKANSPLQIALIGGIGAMLADLILFKLARLLFFGSVSPLTLNKNFNSIVKSLHRNPTFNFVAPFIGAVIIASPLPDELGVAILGLSKMPTVKVAILTYFLNSLGIFVLAYFAQQII